MVAVYFRIATGTTGFSAGVGNYFISLPVAAATELTTFQNNFPIGKAYFNDNGAIATSSVFTAQYNVSNGAIFLRPPDANAWSNTTPVTLAQDDRITGYCIYPTSAP